MSKMRWVGLSVLALLLGTCGTCKIREAIVDYRAGREQAMLEKKERFVRVYYGRMSFEVPERAKHGGTQSFGRMGLMELTTKPWPLPANASPDQREAEYRRQWDAYIREKQ